MFQYCVFINYTMLSTLYRVSFIITNSSNFVCWHAVLLLQLYIHKHDSGSNRLTLDIQFDIEDLALPHCVNHCKWEMQLQNLTYQRNWYLCSYEIRSTRDADRDVVVYHTSIASKPFRALPWHEQSEWRLCSPCNPMSSTMAYSRQKSNNNTINRLKKPVYYATL